MILDGCIIEPEKLLGINIDENSSFSIHTEEIGKKAGRQLSALSRLLYLFILTARLNWLFPERSSSATFYAAQPSGTTILLQMLNVWKRFRRGL